MKKFFLVLVLSLSVTFLSVNAIADDSKLSFDKMRSSFDESFENKTITIPLINGMPPTSEGFEEDINRHSKFNSFKEEKDSEKSNPFINFMEWALGVFLAIWVVWDATNIGVKKGQVPGFPDFGPIGWFFLTLCCWCIGFPFYIVKRKKYIEVNQQGS